MQTKYPSFSPYVYTLNNPLVFDDPGGDTVRVRITNQIVGFTQIRLHSGPEIRRNASLATAKVWVPVYQVDVSNDSGDASTYFFTRYAERQRGTDPNADINDVTFDVRGLEGDFAGIIRSRWGKSNNVLEIRPLNNTRSQTIEGMKGYMWADRVAIQLHALGASDGCLMCAKPSRIESPYGIPNYSGSGTQGAFMDDIMEFQANDRSESLGDFIKITVEKIDWYGTGTDSEKLEYFRAMKDYEENQQNQNQGQQNTGG